MFFEEYGQGADVVGVLVRYKNSANVVNVNVHLGKSSTQTLCVFACIYQERARWRGYYKSVSC